MVDMRKQLRFQESITRTELRPDMILVSETTRLAVILELTVPWDDRMEEETERKRARCDLVDDCHRQGLRTWCLPTEVGCRGFDGWPFRRANPLPGIMGAHTRQAFKPSTEAAERASRWLRLRRTQNTP